MNTNARLVLAALALSPVLALAEPTTWNIDPMHSRASFSVRHLVISNVRGEFQKVSGSARLDEQDLAHSSVEATLDAASIDTQVAKRDEDLRSPNFFDVQRYPTITFKSTKVHAAGHGKLEVTGDLTMHGVTRPVVLHVEGPTAAIKDPWGNLRRGVSATARLNRKEWGLSYGKAVEAGPVVGDEITIQIDAELVKQAGDKTAVK